MTKSRSFSIYLLKDGYTATNTLKDDHALDDQMQGDDLPDDATLFVLDNPPTPPWWKGYFGIQQPLMQTLKGAIVFLPVGDRTFAITFGHVYHNLKSESYEYDFGLRVTLNCLDPDKLKSLDSLSPEKAKRQRTQMPVGSDLTYFDFDRDSTILKCLTGAVKEEHKPFFKHATGASSIRVNSDVGPDGLAGLCAKLLELYEDEAYKISFPDIQNVSPVKDPVKVDALNAKLIAALRDKDESLVLTVPDIVNYADAMHATFSGERKLGLNYDDVFLDRYYEYLAQTGFDLATISLDTIKRHCLVLTDPDGQPRGDRPSILKCLIFDTTLDGGAQTYHLCEGNWYQVNGDYVSALSDYLDPLCAETTLPAYNHDDEAAFNLACTLAAEARLCMDKGNISLVGQKQVEPCDIFEVSDDKIVLHHVKKSTVSATLSHLFNQGLNSIQLIRDETEALENLKALAADQAPDGEEAAFLEAFEGKNYKVTFQIITHKNKDDKSLNLPLFSRISLKRTMKELRRMGIEAEFCFVENQAPRKDGTKRKRNKKAAAGVHAPGEAQAA
jgi:uncharacterized protein (TIGR04141 family)